MLLFFKFCVELRKEVSLYSFKMKSLLDIKNRKKTVCDTKNNTAYRRHRWMRECLLKKKSQKSTQERSSVLFVDFIKSEKIVLGTISFSLERAPAAGTISNRFLPSFV